MPGLERRTGVVAIGNLMIAVEKVWQRLCHSGQVADYVGRLRLRGAPKPEPLASVVYPLAAVTVSVNEHLPPPTVYVYVPAASVASSATMLGPPAVRMVRTGLRAQKR